MKQPFLGGISLWLRIRIYFARHRKHVNENLGLIVALLAAAFAGWASWEAHEARIDTHNDSLLGLKVAQRSYLEVEDATFDSLSKTRTDSHANFSVKVYGNSPAFNINVEAHCFVTPKIGNNALYSLDGGGGSNLSYLYSAWDQDNVHSYPVFIPGTPYKEVALCSTLNNGDLDGFISYGVVRYDDVFDDHHFTEYCFKTDLSPKNIATGSGSLALCSIHHKHT